jgi:UTP--glucose-1-phosphate uridylyltransferase
MLSCEWGIIVLELKKAVIPAAGFGTRMRSGSTSMPKEMLPVGRKPMIQHAVEEVVASGLDEVCIVIRRGKEIIRDYFRKAQASAHTDSEQLIGSCEFTFLYQPEPLGLGDALLQARPFVGNDSFVMVIPDQLMRGDLPATSQLIREEVLPATIRSSLARIPRDDVAFFPGARGFDFDQKTGLKLLTMGELQTEEETHARFNHLDHEIRGFGRTIFPIEVFDYLGKEFANPSTGEVDLARTFAQCTQSLRHEGVLLDGEVFDLGTLESYQHYLPRFSEVGV